MTLKLLIHAPTKNALVRARRNLQNFLATEPQAEVELVANAGAAQMAIEQPDPKTDHYLVLCANSLRNTGLKIPSEHRTVAAAIQHIAKRQSEGWGYFRA